MNWTSLGLPRCRPLKTAKRDFDAEARTEGQAVSAANSYRPRSAAKRQPDCVRPSHTNRKPTSWSW